MHVALWHKYQYEPEECAMCSLVKRALKHAVCRTCDSPCLGVWSTGWCRAVAPGIFAVDSQCNAAKSLQPALRVGADKHCLGLCFFGHQNGGHSLSVQHPPGRYFGSAVLVPCPVSFGSFSPLMVLFHPFSYFCPVAGPI